MSAADTRELLIDAALRAFAEHGIHNASLLEITRMAGQRNRGAVHYHFGSRDRLLVAALEQQSAVLRPRELELLGLARLRPGDLAAAIEALVRPVVELAEAGWRGRCYLMIVADLLADGHAPSDGAIATVLESTGGWEVVELIIERMPPMDEVLRRHRLHLLTGFVLRSAADRARTDDERRLDTERFIVNLTSMATAMLLAPVPA